MSLEERDAMPSDWLAYEDCFKKYSAVESSCIILGALTDQPKVSIMIPTYKRVDLLRESIESALNQKTDIPYEVVVVDNDQSPEIAKQVDALVREFNSPLLRLFRNQQNIGMFGNWNRCIELARGEWVSILNDDDLLMKDWMKSMAPHLKGRSMQASSVEVFGEYDWASNKKSRLGKLQDAVESLILMRGVRHKIIASDMFLGNPVHASLGVLMHKEALMELGGYNEKYWPISDYVFNVRYALVMGGYVLKKQLARYRYSVNESLNPATMVKFATMTYELRRQLIDLLWENKGYRALMTKVNAFQAYNHAFNYHCILGDKLDWRHVLDDMKIPHSNVAPGKFKRAFARLAWIILSNPGGRSRAEVRQAIQCKSRTLNAPN